MQQRIWFDAPVSVKMNVRRLLNLVFPQEWHTAVAARHAGLLARWLCWLSNMNINAAVTSLPQAFIFFILQWVFHCDDCTAHTRLLCRSFKTSYLELRSSSSRNVNWPLTSTSCLHMSLNSHAAESACDESRYCCSFVPPLFAFLSPDSTEYFWHLVAKYLCRLKNFFNSVVSLLLKKKIHLLRKC